MDNTIKSIYKKLSIGEIIKMNEFDKAELTCQRMFIKFSNLFLQDYPDFRIKLTNSGTIYDAMGKSGNRKFNLEFKTRTTIYEDMYIEPKNVNWALLQKEKGIEYLYINFYDDTKSGKRFMFIWSSYDIDFTTLENEKKSIAKTEVTDSHLQYQTRFKLPLSLAKKYEIKITELFPECQTQEYITAYFESIKKTGF